MPDHHVAAVVPAWNEAAAIAPVVRGLAEAGACCVYVVDAGSTDGTPELASSAGARVVHEPRRGYGRACLSGAQAAMGHQLIAFLDGDGSCDPAELPRLLAVADNADLVLGRRTEIAPGALAWHARAGNRLVATLIGTRTGRGVHDLPPFKVVRSDAIAALGLSDVAYGWTVELVGRAIMHPALRVVEAPVSFRQRIGGTSKVSGRLGPSLRAGRAMLSQAVGATRSRGLLVLMAKAPACGRSKTRLAADVGERVAAGFWAASLQDSARKLLAVALEEDMDVLAMTPSEEDAAGVRCLTGLPCLVQRLRGLGQALLEVSELPAPFSIAISADVPTLPPEVLREAVLALRSAPAVLGPGEDGGYYLVGTRRALSVRLREKAFLEAPMGGEQVFAHTRAALGSTAELRSWPDVDTGQELGRLALQLEQDPTAAPAVAAWLDGSGNAGGVVPAGFARRREGGSPPSGWEAG